MSMLCCPFGDWQVTKPLAAWAIIGMGLLWAAMGGALLMATEFLDNQTTKCVRWVPASLPPLTWQGADRGWQGSGVPV
jgi:hypothetical protein